MKKDSPFTFANSILSTKKYIPEEYKEKDVFLTNRSISQHVDSILYVNEMNINSHIPTRWQYDYLFHTVRKMNRPYGKWGSKKNSKEVELIKTFFGYSDRKARDVAHMFSKSQLTKMKEMLETGG